MSRKNKAIDFLSQDFEVEIIPFYESREEFQKRSDIVHSIVSRMIASGRKRGRPSVKDVSYEESA